LVSSFEFDESKQVLETTKIIFNGYYSRIGEILLFKVYLVTITSKPQGQRSSWRDDRQFRSINLALEQEMGAGASTVVPRATVETWDEEAVSQWVTGLGDAYVPYGASMKQKGVNGMKLLALEEKDLLELGVTPDHTKKLLSEKDRLNGAYYDTVNETHSTAEMREGDSAVITDGGRGVVLSFGAGELSAELAGLEGISVSSGNGAASKLQARQRGNQARAEVKAQKDSAAKIQSIQRGKQVRTEIQQKQNSAAKIQAIQVNGFESNVR
jgi:hypothetical protein